MFERVSLVGLFAINAYGIGSNLMELEVRSVMSDDARLRRDSWNTNSNIRIGS